MATKTVTELLDDVSGDDADETVTFGLDGVQYEIDLSAKNATTLRDVFALYTAHGRRIGARGRAVRSVSTGVDTRAVRAWAASNGVELSERGRIPSRVIEQYRAAGN